MVNRTKCPICGREGIPDYRKNDVTCQYCGNSLKAFYIIEQLEQEAKSKATIWKPIGIAALVAALVFALLYFTKSSLPTSEKERLSVLEDSIATLNEMLKDGGQNVFAQNAQGKAADAKAKQTEKLDKVVVVSNNDSAKKVDAQGESGEAAKETNDKPAENITAPADMVTIKNGKKYYTVKKGDSWWKICGKLYKHKVSDTELAKMNGKSKETSIDVGQEILVK